MSNNSHGALVVPGVPRVSALLGGLARPDGPPEPPEDVVDFTDNLNLKWYNYFESAPASLFASGANRSVLRSHPASSATLHGYQSLGTNLKCGINVTLNQVEKQIRSTPESDLTFSMAGGAEIPHLRVQLTLKHPDSTKESLALWAVWTAWSEELTDADRVVNEPSQSPALGGVFTFSSRLQRVRAVPIALNPVQATICRGQVDDEGCLLSWTQRCSPYCYGFHIPSRTVKQLGFSDSQVKALEVFKGLSHVGAEISLITRGRRNIPQYWRFMTAMPIPTPAPYPYYDCRFDRTHLRFTRIAAIPPVTDQVVRAHHARRIKGWVNSPPGFITGSSEIEAMHTTAPTTFINEREYEVVKTVGSLREAEYRRETYEAGYNHDYSFDLIPAATIHGVVDESMDQFYYALLETTSRTGDINEGFDHILSIPELYTPVTISVTISVTTESKDHSPLIVGRPQNDSEIKWNGQVVATPTWYEGRNEMLANRICILVKRPQKSGSSSIVLRLTGRVEFCFREREYPQSLVAIRYAMYGDDKLGIPRDTDVKSLLLGHNNHVLKYKQSTGKIELRAQARINHRAKILNDRQVSVLKSAFRVGDRDLDLFTLVVGPPGTGKTVVAATIAVEWCQLDHPVLVVCASNRGLDIIAKRVVAELNASGQNSSTDYIFRLETDSNENQGAELTDERVSNVFSSGQVTDLRRLRITPFLFECLCRWVETRASHHNCHNLNKHILARLTKAYNEGTTWQQTTSDEKEEYQLLWSLMTWKSRVGFNFAEPLSLPESENSSEIPQEQQDVEHRELVANFKHAWEALQEFYTSRAKIVFCTASTAGRKALRKFNPTCIIVEEASQMAEATCLNSFIRHYKSVKKIVLTGDPAQLPLTVMSGGRNEFYESERMSLFERLMTTGFPAINLEIQYTMHPDIAQFVSDEFYGGKLVNHPCCSDRPQSRDFRDTMLKYAPNCKNGNSYFVSVKNSSVWQKRGHHSMFNPEYVAKIGELICFFIKDGWEQQCILVLTYYAEEQRILSELINKSYGYKDIQIECVDAAQGIVRELVIVSTCRLGREFGLGRVNDRNRQNVGLSRARDGLLIIGNENMAGKNTSLGFKSWRSAVEYFRDNRRLITVQGDRALLEKRLRIPNDQEYALL